MEAYEKINSILKDKGITKKELANRLISIGARLKSTGEIPTEQAIYSYLNGNREMKIELIPHIAEALDICEQEIFDFDQKARLKFLKAILKNPTQKELDLIKYELKIEKIDVNIKNSIVGDIIESDLKINNNRDNKNIDLKNEDRERLDTVIELLEYAPEPFLENIIEKLKKIKDISTS